VIDLFGEIAGVTFTPDTDGLYIANADENYGFVIMLRITFNLFHL
jgi:hypothetical protein